MPWLQDAMTAAFRRDPQKLGWSVVTLHQQLGPYHDVLLCSSPVPSWHLDPLPRKGKNVPDEPRSAASGRKDLPAMARALRIWHTMWATCCCCSGCNEASSCHCHLLFEHPSNWEGVTLEVHV